MGPGEALYFITAADAKLERGILAERVRAGMDPARRDTRERFRKHWGMCGPVDEAQSCTDNRRRMALYHQADRLLVAEEAAIIPTVYSRRVALVHPRVKGWWSGIGYRSLGELIIEETE